MPELAEPITTEMLRYGLRVAVLGIPAPRLIATPEALEVVGPAAFGYPGVAYDHSEWGVWRARWQTWLGPGSERDQAFMRYRRWSRRAPGSSGQGSPVL